MPEFVEWMMGLPIGWTEGHPRGHRLRMLGNSVCPQQGELAIRLILDQGGNRMTEIATCVDGPDGCAGTVEFRYPLSPSGRPFPRCDRHWEARLNEQERINVTYPTLQPADFDPGYAGERWDEEE